MSKYKVWEVFIVNDCCKNHCLFKYFRLVPTSAGWKGRAERTQIIPSIEVMNFIDVALN